MCRAAECFTASADFITISWALFAAFFACVMAACVAAALQSKRPSVMQHVPLATPLMVNRTAKAETPSRGLRLSFLIYFLLDLMYLPLSTRFLQIFRCVTIDSAGLYFLQAAPYVDCRSSGFRHLRAFAIVGMPLCLVGVPLLFFLRIRVHRHELDNSPLRHEMGFVWSVIRRRLYWWPAVNFGRKAVIAIIVTQLPRGDILVPMLVLALLMALIVLQLSFRPYVFRVENTISAGLLMLALFSYNSSILLGLNSVFWGRAGVSSVSNAVVVLNTGVKVVLALLLLVNSCPCPMAICKRCAPSVAVQSRLVQPEDAVHDDDSLAIQKL